MSLVSFLPSCALQNEKMINYVDVVSAGGQDGRSSGRLPECVGVTVVVAREHDKNKRHCSLLARPM